MAFQIRRAHRFLPPPQDLIALRTFNHKSKNIVPDTLFFILRSVFNPEVRSIR